MTRLQRCFLPAAAAVFALASMTAGRTASAQDVLMEHNDLARTGANLNETILNTTTVSSGKFGKLWTLYADGQVVAQPLYVSNLRVDTSGNTGAPLVRGTFNAVIVATMHNTVYVYDADKENRGPDSRTIPLWGTWLGPPRPGGKDIDMWSTNDPEWGILSTPVVSQDKSTLFVVAWHNDGPAGFAFRLHALNLTNGTHRQPPVQIGPSSADPSRPCVPENVFNPCQHKQRPAVLLADGVIYVGFGGDGNRGALFAFDAGTLAQRAFWSSTPTGKDGGLWQSGQGLAVDAAGSLYLMTGNGSFDANTGGQNFGSSFVKLRLQGGSFAVEDYFTPCNVNFLNTNDLDLGSSGPLLVPDTPARIVGGGKEGVLYVVSLDNMGKFAGSTDPDCRNNNIVQQVSAFAQVHGHWGNIHGSPVYWKGPDVARVYSWGENNPLKAYKFAAGQFQETASPKQSAFRPPLGMPGGMLSISADGAKAGSGIVWAVVPFNGDANQQRGVHGIVLALDAEDVSRTLWTSEQVAGRDQLGLFAKFTPPTVANGKIFVATYGDDEPLQVYAPPVRPTQFPANYYVAVFGMQAAPVVAATVVDQDKDDVALVRATTGPLILDMSKCTPLGAESVECTDALSQTAGAPSFHHVIMAANQNLSTCKLVRVTAAAKNAALPTAAGIGFWSTQALGGNTAAENAGRLIAKDQLKQSGSATLKDGSPATLYDFVGVADCLIESGGPITRLFKPYMEFDGANGTVFRNWDLSSNYQISPDVNQIDRSAAILQQ